MKFPKWYIRIIIKVALALFDHVNLKVTGFDTESENIIARININ